MQQTSICSYDDLEARLASAAAASGAAEAHGLLCGIICGGGTASPETWLDHLLGKGNTLSAAARDSPIFIFSKIVGSPQSKVSSIFLREPF